MTAVRLAGAIVVAALLTASSASAASYAEKVCKGPATGVGGHANQIIARAKAQTAWAQQVLAQNGTGWANVGTAQVIQDGCQPYRSPQPGRSDHWSCTFVAAPCKWRDTQVTPHVPRANPSMRGGSSELLRRTP